jgi:TRAP-type C4-dicarboxylate transport system substrate-binding protein
MEPIREVETLVHKSFRVIALAVAALSCAVFGGAQSGYAADPYVVNINVWGGKRALTAGLEMMTAKINKEFGDKYQIKIHYGAALGPHKQAPEAVKTGGYEGAMFAVGYYPNKFPLLSVMELPFLAPRKTEDRAKVERALFAQPDIAAEMAKRWKIHYFAPAIVPAYEFMGNSKIASVADMKGVKMRISGLNSKALQVFGAVPTMVTAPEGYTALERGTIDSFGFPYSYAFGAYKLYEVSKYCTEGIGMGGIQTFIGISLNAWNKMPEKLKAMLPELQKKAAEALFVAYEKADKKWIPIFKEKLEVSQFPPAERAKLASGASKFWGEWAAEQEAAGRPGKKILEFVKAEVAKATK